MNIKAATRRLNNKVVSVSELNRYFGTKSVDELLQKLRQLVRDGYLGFEVCLSAEYFNWQKAHHDVILSSNINHGADYGYESLRKRDSYGLSFNSSKPLQDEEVVEVIQKLPADLINQYIRFKLWDIDQENLLKIIAKRQKFDNDEFEDRVELNGLVADGAEIMYRGESIKMSFRHRQVVRLLLNKQGGLCYRDEFTDRHASIFKQPASYYKDVNATLRKLIAEVRQELTVVIKKDCIENDPSEGWRLKLEP